MRRTRIDQDMVADYNVLANAAVKAASGKRGRPDIRHFFTGFDNNIGRIRQDLISGLAPYNRFRNFTIYDPKERVITAVGFDDRVIHHALMGLVGPVLEKAMIPHTYACRPGKGPLRSVIQAQVNIRKYPWYVKIDISKYFETIDHAILTRLLLRKFKGEFFFFIGFEDIGRVFQRARTGFADRIVDFAAFCQLLPRRNRPLDPGAHCRASLCSLHG